MTQWQNAKEYIELSFSIEEYFPSFVDGYFGPKEIKESVEKRGKTDLKELSTTTDRIFKSTQQDNSLTQERKEYLLAQLTGMRTTLEVLQGKQFDVFEEMQRYYQLTPTWKDESEFEAIHQVLDELLPGSGSLYSRVESFRKKTVLPKDKIKPLIIDVSTKLQNLSKDFIPLPESENCEYFLVKDQPWTAYNWYLGNYQSRIEINTDLPVQLMYFPWFIAHEAYPGHHTDNVIKEKMLFQEKGYLENSILIFNTPENVLSEGIGENALEIVASPDEIKQIFQIILNQTGIKEFDGNSMYKIMRARKDLGILNVNLVLMLHDRDASDQEVIDYQIKYGLNSKERAKKFLEFLRNPLYRSYACLYPMGRQLVHNYISAGKNRKDRFLELLQGQFTPSHLVRNDI